SRPARERRQGGVTAGGGRATLRGGRGSGRRPRPDAAPTGGRGPPPPRRHAARRPPRGAAIPPPPGGPAAPAAMARDTTAGPPRRGVAHVPSHGRRRHLRPDRGRVPPILGRFALAGAALREDALRQRRDSAPLPRAVPGDRRSRASTRRGGDA